MCTLPLKCFDQIDYAESYEHPRLKKIICNAIILIRLLLFLWMGVYIYCIISSTVCISLYNKAPDRKNNNLLSRK